MHKKSFKNVKAHQLIVDDDHFYVMYKEKIDNDLGMEMEISILDQKDSVDILLTNLYFPKMRLGTRRQDSQQTVFSLSKENAKKLRDYLNDVLNE